MAKLPVWTKNAEGIYLPLWIERDATPGPAWGEDPCMCPCDGPVLPPDICPHGCAEELQITVSGIGNADCVDCDNLNGTALMTFSPGGRCPGTTGPACAWTAGFANLAEAIDCNETSGTTWAGACLGIGVGRGNFDIWVVLTYLFGATVIFNGEISPEAFGDCSALPSVPLFEIQFDGGVCDFTGTNYSIASV